MRKIISFDMVSCGYDTWLNSNQITAVIPTRSRWSKRAKKMANETDTLMDLTEGRAEFALVIMNNGYIASVSSTPHALVTRWRREVIEREELAEGTVIPVVEEDSKVQPVCPT
jgi:regulator of extracellular matrix RemA (YlzA/DUF370 family)